MARHLEQQQREAAATVVDLAGASSATRRGEARASARGDGDLGLFGDVDPALHLRMELVARASASPERALPSIIALLVEGDDKRSAIVTAIGSNDALREQWQRTWEVLRR